MIGLKLRQSKLRLAICKLEPDADVPARAKKSSFFSITKTDSELSIVCEQANVPADIRSEKDWNAFQVEGTLDFSLTGILASIAEPLAHEKISMFAISTFDTDFVLVKSEDAAKAKQALEKKGFCFAID